MSILVDPESSSSRSVLRIEALKKNWHSCPYSLSGLSDGVFFDQHPDLGKSLGSLLRMKRAETWLGRDRTSYALGFPVQVSRWS